MANLTVENLNRIVQTGDVEKLFTGTLQRSGPSVSEAEAGSSSGKNFADVLSESLNKTNIYQTQADTAIKEMVAGRNKNIHETMLTVERADTSLKLMMQVRNKILDAYREIMRMQV